MPTGKTKVFVTNITDDGQTGLLTGNIYISQNISFDQNQGETQPKALMKACVHELMHIVQDYYYTTNFTFGAYRWWMEATATLADRLVFPNNPPFESEMYVTSKTLNLHKSWDDCNSDPEWYLAGGFLTYLCYYRSGTKASLADLVKECGEIKNGIFIRDAVNNYLTKNFRTTINQEYHNYIYWYLTNNKFGYYSNFTDDRTPFTDYITINSTDETKESNYSNIPILGGRVIRLVSTSSKDEKVKINFKTQNNVRAYYYLNTQKNGVNSKTFIKEISNIDSFEVDLIKDPKTWVEIYVINESLSKNGGYNFKVKVLQSPLITSINPTQGKPGSNMTIYGINFGSSKGNSKLYFGNNEITEVTDWYNTFINLKVPNLVGTHNVYVIVNGLRSNSVTFTVENDDTFKELFNCKYIDIDIPFLASFESTRDENGNITTAIFKDQYRRIYYDYQSTYGQNDIKFNGSDFEDSLKIIDLNGTVRIYTLKGKFSSDYSSISSLTYTFDSKNKLNDSNYVNMKTVLVVNNIPFFFKKADNSLYSYGSYANQGKAAITKYDFTYEELETVLLANGVKRVYSTSKSTGFRNYDTDFIKVGFSKTP